MLTKLVPAVFAHSFHPIVAGTFGNLMNVAYTTSENDSDEIPVSPDISP
jgi:hypothetical protein